jgi:predicted TIM-barrel fold metal-dependent hydrolase
VTYWTRGSEARARTSPLIIDSQVHLFDADTSSRPWPRDPDRMAAPRPSFSATEMLLEMDAIGVDRAVIVPPVWAGDENDVALAAAAAYPTRFAVMGRFDPFAPNLRERLEQRLASPFLLGFRMSGRWGPQPTGFMEALEEGSLEEFWNACESLHAPVMCLTLQHPEVLGAVADRHPGLALIVDHMAGAGPPAQAGSTAVLQSLVDLSRYPRIYVKVSGVPNRSQDAFPFADMHPVVWAIYDAFGPDRMMWAADFTQLTKNTYAECLRVWQEGIPFLTESDRSAILGETAARVLGWPGE